MGHEKLPKPQSFVPLTAVPTNDWAPAHQVTLSPYFIDRFKVTWARFRKCAAAGICSTEGLSRRPETRSAYEHPELGDLPAAGITYKEASDFCLWDGKRLPTEAEWERAARGPGGTDYPWGNSTPSPDSLSVVATYGGSGLPLGVTENQDDRSPEGIVGLVTGDAEWVSDWYSPEAYPLGAVEDPTGPSRSVNATFAHEYGGGNFVVVASSRVVRGWRGNTSGGADWESNRIAPSWFRDQRDPRSGATFRCARSLIHEPSPAIYRAINWRMISGGTK